MIKKWSVFDTAYDKKDAIKIADKLVIKLGNANVQIVKRSYIYEILTAEIIETVSL